MERAEVLVLKVDVVLVVVAAAEIVVTSPVVAVTAAPSVADFGWVDDPAHLFELLVDHLHAPRGLQESRIHPVLVAEE